MMRDLLDAATAHTERMQTVIDAALPEHDVQLWARADEPDGSALLRDAEREGNFASMRLQRPALPDLRPRHRAA